MAIITTTETIPAYGNHLAQTITRVTGEPAPPRNRPPASPEPAKFVELSVDELRALLTEETAKLATMDEEIKLITERLTEVRLKLSNNERALVSALEQNKAVLAAYSRGKADDKAVSQGKAAVRDLEDLIAGLKDVIGVITSELAALQEPRKYQKERIVESTHNRVWRVVAELEREAAKPFLHRAHCAEMQAGNFRPSNSAVMCPDSEVKTVIADLLNEYNLPPR